jgi:hypothetical protein
MKRTNDGPAMAHAGPPGLVTGHWYPVTPARGKGRITRPEAAPSPRALEGAVGRGWRRAWARQRWGRSAADAQARSRTPRPGTTRTCTATGPA